MRRSTIVSLMISAVLAILAVFGAKVYLDQQRALLQLQGKKIQRILRILVSDNINKSRIRLRLPHISIKTDAIICHGKVALQTLQRYGKKLRRLLERWLSAMGLPKLR